MTALPILMTASVSTRGMRGAAFSAEERERMYAETLAFYLAAFPASQPIVFAENSGWNLDALRAQVPPARRGAVEWVSLDPAGFDIARGKGHNEIRLINGTLTRSAFLRDAGRFLKVTGRYPIYNLPRYHAAAQAFLDRGGAFYGDMKDHRIFDVLQGRRAWTGHALGTALFATTVAFYRQRLAETYPACNDATGDCIEKVWFRVMKPYRTRGDGTVSLRFDEEPRYGGKQGSVNHSLLFAQDNQSWRSRFKCAVRTFTRRHVRWLWI